MARLNTFGQSSVRKQSSVDVDDSISQQGTLVRTNIAPVPQKAASMTVASRIPSRSISQRSKAPTPGRRRTHTVATPSSQDAATRSRVTVVKSQPDVLKLAHSYRVLHI